MSLPLRRPSCVTLAAAMLLLGACTAPQADPSTTPSPSVSDSPTAEVVPPEFDEEVGDGLVLGEEVEAESVAEEDGGVRMYRPMAIDPKSDLLDYDPSSSYASTDPDWSMTFLDDGDADDAMSTASTYLVEVYLDSPVFFESDPAENLRWAEENRDLYSDETYERVRQDVQAPGQRTWMLLVEVDGEEDDPSDGGGDDDEVRFFMDPAYDLAPQRWSGLSIEPTAALGAVGSDDEDVEYASFEYSISGNLLLRVNQSTDVEKIAEGPQALPFRANVSIEVIRSPGEEWRVDGISAQGSLIGEEPNDLEHPYEEGS